MHVCIVVYSMSYIYVCLFPLLCSPSPGRGARGRPDLPVTSSHCSLLCSNSVQHVKLQQSGAASGGHILLTAALNIHLQSSAIPSTSPPLLLQLLLLFDSLSWWSNGKLCWRSKQESSPITSIFSVVNVNFCTISVGQIILVVVLHGFYVPKMHK